MTGFQGMVGFDISYDFIYIERAWLKITHDIIITQDTKYWHYFNYYKLLAYIIDVQLYSDATSSSSPSDIH